LSRPDTAGSTMTLHYSAALALASERPIRGVDGRRREKGTTVWYSVTCS